MTTETLRLASTAATFEPLTLEYSGSECDQELQAYVYIHRPSGCTLVLFND